MMDQELLQPFDVDIEDGELSESSEAENDDVDVYTPLQRPTTLASAVVVASPKTASVSAANNNEPLSNCTHMQQALDEDIGNDDSNGDISSDSSSGESTDSCLKKLSADGSGSKSQRKKKRTRRTVMVRIQPTNDQQEKQRARFKKYDIWTASLQEDALTENMRGIEMTKSSRSDRNVENYDFSLKYHLNGENSLKRRLSNSTDDISDNEYHQLTKRGRSNALDGSSTIDNVQRKSAKSRLGGHRSRGTHNRRGSSPTSGSDTNSYEARHILDLEEPQGREPLDVAREIANKLYEEHDELIVRIVQVLGIELPTEIYKETQRIEADGGMMIKNGLRRRTPGGVFLFLLKEDDRLTTEERKLIFVEERKNSNKWRKEMKALSRDRKVEELKKRLSKQKELPALSTRKEHFLLGSELSLESQTANLSNPPPSPVGQEHSPEYKTHAINHVQTEPASPEKPSTSASALAALTTPSKDLIGYDDDFLDVNCGEMDFF